MKKMNGNKKLSYLFSHLHENEIKKVKKAFGTEKEHKSVDRHAGERKKDTGSNIQG